ncbi:hypothetical protein OSB04_018675 [Centaurea solstitialis]|uniref:non-specific serine/threonine protein kinase n=1 Tax=Centaurea solstitialis TaxID=347529 RepID=A0AA38WJJ3_9ASTR|nr:hypothetical protein OSB04_018675 [Centaurea solstitialis]
MRCFSCINCFPKDVENYDGNLAANEFADGKLADSVREKRFSSQRGNVARGFTFRELAVATQNFKDANLIGEGGFGSVYKGRLESGEIVAVKQLNLNGLQGNQEFIVEVLMLSLLRHSNLVTLIGYCADGDQRLLVYEYMPLGSLENHLFDLEPGREPLDWHTRLKIAVGAARGLEYLHCKANPPVIYRDLKSSNILLDNDFNPKLSDFGLAKLGPVGDNTHVSTRVMGTYGYCAPDYAMSGKLTLKSDIYSFGVVLLELITGRRAIDTTKKPGEQNLVAWSRPFLKDRKKFVQLVDPLLQGCFSVRSVHHVIAVTAMCLQEQANFRPLIGDIVVALEYLASQAEMSENHKGLTVGSQPSPGHARRERKGVGVGVGLFAERLVEAEHPQRRGGAAVLAYEPEVAGNPKKQAAEHGTTSDHDGGGTANSMMSKGQIVTPNLKMYTYAELQTATKNFRPATILGEGGFGQVYKGWVDGVTYAPSKTAGVGIPVAVKKSDNDSFQGLKEWQAEVKFLGKFSHPNLVKLLGYCWENNGFLLVYEYMQKGSLENHLFKKSSEPLSWETRIKIAIGAAQGLAFLHTTENKVIYRDFKSSNILLDGEFNAKLSDFGLAKLGPINGESHVSTMVMGTYGYAAPEYMITGHLYVKSDVYGFGVVMLEMITGLRVLDPNRPSSQQNLVDWARPFLADTKKLPRIMDPRMEQAYPSTCAVKAAKLILHCLDPNPSNRPSMEEVVASLEEMNAIKMKPKQLKVDTKHHMSPHNKQKLRDRRHGNHHRSPLHTKQGGGAQFDRTPIQSYNKTLP